MLEMATKTDTRLSGKLAALRTRYPASDPEMVAEVVREVLLTMRGDLSARETGLLAEIEDLGRVISTARAEIAALQVDDITASHIPSATDELDAIVAHTAGATDSILEVCETLDRVAGGLLGEPAAALQDATTKIYEACSFQDISGQRISKIVATLKTIDAKVAHIVSAFGGAEDGAPPPRAAPLTLDRAAPHGHPPLHGPQLPANAMDQTGIDKLLASFD